MIFLNYVNGVLCQIDNEHKIDQLYRLFSSVYQPYEELVIEKKALIEERNLAGDVDNLTRLLKRISGQTRKGRDFTLYGLKRALVEVLTLFPIYRTYISAEGHSDADLNYINIVIEQAKERDPLLVQELSYIKTLFLLEFPDDCTEQQRQEQLYFVMRLQQLTGPLMAKGVEDTLFYVYNRLISLNEVGGNPGQLGISLEAFHAFNRKRCDRWPEAMSATATHDTKRGEDARARINVLSEIPGEWEQHLFQWRELNRDKKTRHERNLVPSTNDEYCFYQAILGSFPFEAGEYPEFVERVKAYTIKAIREAKVRTAWLRPDTQYEAGCLQFVEAVLSQNPENIFLESFLPFQKKLAFYGILNSLSQVLLKFTAPGIADVYQGTELWDLSFVDPDNRRPVDYQRRQTYLQDIKAKEQQDRLGLLTMLLNSPEDGKIKLYLSYCALQARKDYAAVFQQGNYHPLLAEGSFSQHIIAFQRTNQDTTVVAIAPRFYTSLVLQDTLPLGETVWQDTQIQLSDKGIARWKNLLTGEFYKSNGKLEIGKVLQHFPVALLVSG
ncbi:malto-oligosyltrehalose synthase [bacterium]|nr:malto-oligosyltrehalose synthase [bacterium]